MEKAEKTLQEEKAQLLEQYKQVKTLEGQGKDEKHEYIENARLLVCSLLKILFSNIFTTLQLGLKTQPSPQSPTAARQANVIIKASTWRSISSKETFPVRLITIQPPVSPSIPQQYPIPIPRIQPIPPSKYQASLLIYGKLSSRLSSPLSPKMDLSLHVTECPASVNSSVTFSVPLPSSLSKDQKVIDASSINCLDISTSTAPSLVPPPVKQQQASEVVATSSVGPMQGNDTYRMRCPPSLY